MKEAVAIAEAIEQMESQGVFVIRDQISTCTVCKKKKDLRMGLCFECAEKEDSDG